MKITKIHPDKYPQLLAQISNPPKQLYCLGEISDKPKIAVIGSRRPTDYGQNVTYKLAYELASAGICIVSGLAIGLDGVAHQAALDAGGETIAVLPSGLGQIYPARHKKLARDILKAGGALISEYATNQKAQQHSFVARNRIVAGLSLGVIVTEAAAASGTLTTANFALNENRLVMAVPGNITSLYSAGPNNLIRAGAVTITSSSDVLSILEIETEDLPVSISKNQENHPIIDDIVQGFDSTELLLQTGRYEPTNLAVELSLLEISGQIRNLGNGNWTVR